MEQKTRITDISSSNILVVDDDLETCKMLEMLFAAKGYHTTIAYGGNEALQCVQSASQDLVVLDVMMPDMDGWETFRRLRNITNIPVIFLTALSSGEYAARALEMGLNDYVSKPFSPAELLARIELLLKNLMQQRVMERHAIRQWDYQDRPSVSIIIPTLNEATNLPLVLPYLPLDCIDEILLVDGLSTDNTVDVARKLIPGIKIILERNHGKGKALRSGYRASNGQVVIVMDADGSHDPREIPRFIKALIEGADLVKGTRFTPGGGTTDMPRLRQFGNRLFTMITNLLFNVRFTDLCYGYHAFWRYCLDNIMVGDVDGFEIDTAIYLRAIRQHLRVTEVPSFEGYRFRGQGKLRTFPDGWRVLRTIVREYLCNIRKPCVEYYLGFRGKCPDEITLQPRNSTLVDGMWKINGDFEKKRNVPKF